MLIALNLKKTLPQVIIKIRLNGVGVGLRILDVINICNKHL